MTCGPGIPGARTMALIPQANQGYPDSDTFYGAHILKTASPGSRHGAELSVSRCCFAMARDNSDPRSGDQCARLCPSLQQRCGGGPPLSMPCRQCAPAMGREPMGREPMGREPMGREPMGREPMGREPMGREPSFGHLDSAWRGTRTASTCPPQLPGQQDWLYIYTYICVYIHIYIHATAPWAARLAPEHLAATGRGALGRVLGVADGHVWPAGS
jgi:hypothetical protein